MKQHRFYIVLHRFYIICIETNKALILFSLHRNSFETDKHLRNMFSIRTNEKALFFLQFSKGIKHSIGFAVCCMNNKKNIAFTAFAYEQTKKHIGCFFVLQRNQLCVRKWRNKYFLENEHLHL